MYISLYVYIYICEFQINAAVATCQTTPLTRTSVLRIHVYMPFVRLVMNAYRVLVTAMLVCASQYEGNEPAVSYTQIKSGVPYCLSDFPLS